MMNIEINIDRRIAKYDDPKLFEVYVHNYDDSYHKESSDIDEVLERRVRAMSSRPRRLTEYYESMELYYEWMAHLEYIHGGKDLLKMKIKNGVVKEYIPAKPRLKSKSLRRLAKKGVRLSERRSKHIDFEEVAEWAEENLNPHKTPETVQTETVFKSKEAEKARMQSIETNARKIKSKGYASDVDYIDEWFKMKNISTMRDQKKSLKKKGKKKYKDEQPKLIATYMRSDYLDGLEKSTQKDPMTQYNGILLSAENMESLAVYHKLAELGWNSYKLMRKADFSKRTLAQFKKMNKKKKKKKKKAIDSSVGMLFGDIIADNGYNDYEEFRDDMLDMSWDNIRAQYKDRDDGIFDQMFS